MFLLEEVVEVTDQKNPRPGARDSLQLLQQIAEASCDRPICGREPLGHQIFDHIQHRMLASLGARVVQQFVPQYRAADTLAGLQTGPQRQSAHVGRHH